MQGTITDIQTKETLPGVNIYVSDALGNPLNNGISQIGSATDINGFYAINSDVSGQYITASMLGYKKQTKPATGQTLNFQLQESATMLNEVIITAKRINKIDKYKIPALILVLGLSLIVIYKYS